MVTRVFKRNDEIITVTGYNEKFVEFAREKKAKWDKYKKSWSFDQNLEKEVIEKVKEIYGGKIITSVYDDTNRIQVYFDLQNGLKAKFSDFDKKMQDFFRTEGFRFCEREGKVFLYFPILEIENADDRNFIDYVGLDPTGYKVDFEKEILEIKDNAEFVVFEKLYRK